MLHAETFLVYIRWKYRWVWGRGWATTASCSKNQFIVNLGTRTSTQITCAFSSTFQKQVVHCLVVVSRLSPSIADKRDIGVHYEKLFKACQQRYQGEGPTGLLLVYPQHCVHLIESPWEVVTEVVSDLCSMQRQQWVQWCQFSGNGDL